MDKPKSQPQPVTFESLIDALRAKEEVISEEEVLRFVEALEQQVQALRDEWNAKADELKCGNWNYHQNEISRLLVCAGKLTALLGKREGQWSARGTIGTKGKMPS